MSPRRQSFLPLSSAAFHILVALADQDKHGYAIMQEVAARTSGEVKLNAGTLYTTLKRLVEEDLIVEVRPPKDADSTDERRRYYRLTSLGREAAKAELARLQTLVRQAAATLRAKT
jgi:DNA-binding PadR family transcriptional regulator